MFIICNTISIFRLFIFLFFLCLVQVATIENEWWTNGQINQKKKNGKKSDSIWMKIRMDVGKKHKMNVHHSFFFGVFIHKTPSFIHHQYLIFCYHFEKKQIGHSIQTTTTTKMMKKKIMDTKVFLNWNEMIIIINNNNINNRLIL